MITLLKPWLKLVILVYLASLLCTVESASRTSRRRTSSSSNAVHGKWGSWSHWGHWGRKFGCSEECGGGYQTRTRACNSPKPKNGGRKCAGSDKQRRSCNDDVECTGSSPLPSQSCKVSIFQDGSFNGIEDVYTENTAQLTRNDDLSSIKVSSDCCAILYKDADYKGESRKVCKDMNYDDLGDEWNDQASSIMIERQSHAEGTTPQPSEADAPPDETGTKTIIVPDVNPTNLSLNTEATEASEVTQEPLILWTTAKKDAVQSTKAATTTVDRKQQSASAATLGKGSTFIMIFTFLFMLQQLFS